MRRQIASGALLLAAAVAALTWLLDSEGDCESTAACSEPPVCEEFAGQGPIRPTGNLRHSIRFGFNEGSAIAGHTDPGLVARLHQVAGASLTRFALDWRRVEPRRDDYEFGIDDRVYCAAIANGVAPIIAIAAAPLWARDEAGSRCEGCLQPPRRDSLGELRELAAIVTRRYPKAAAIEAWNEPNLRLFWERPDPERYAEVLEAVYEGVKSAAPGRIVLGGSLANPTAARHAPNDAARFADKIYSAGGGEHMDALSAHPYPGYPLDDDRQTFDPLIARLKKVSLEHGYPRQPIWITEVGLPTDGGADLQGGIPGPKPPRFGELAQARTIIAMLERADADPRIPVLIIHTLLEPDGRVASHGGFGLIGVDGQVLRAKMAWCALLRWVEPGTDCTTDQQLG